MRERASLPAVTLPKLPRFTLPPVVAKVVSRLPARPAARVLGLALDFGIDRIVSRAGVEPLLGRRFALSVRDLGLTVHFEGTAEGFRPSRSPYAPELAIGATLRDFIALALREEDPDTLFFARRLTIEGDTELGLVVKNLLDGIDWAGLLARLPVPFLHRR
jgi:O2-independent ubiquinone biosynthesis accessory factor UbiT